MLNTSQVAQVENNYATLFFDYIRRSLDEALEGVRAVQNRLADEERVQACHVLDYGLRAAESWTSARDLTVALATYMERGGHWEIWQHFLERAIAAAQRRHDIQYEITLTALLARLYQRWSKPTAMVQSYHKVIRLARRSGNRYELARACSNLGYHYILTGNLWRAEVLSYHALAIFNELESNHGRAHTHNHLGILFTRQYNWVKAKEHLLMACAIWQATQDQFGLMRGYGNLGFLYNEIEKYEDGLYHSTLALELAERLGEEPMTGVFMMNISLDYLKLGNVQKAKECANHATKIFEKYSDKLGLAQITHISGLIEIYNNNYTKALNYVVEAISMLIDHYYLIQVRFTKIELEIQLHNLMAAKQELSEIETLLTKHLADSALQFYTDRLTTIRRRLEQAIL